MIKYNIFAQCVYVSNMQGAETQQETKDTHMEILEVRVKESVNQNGPLFGQSV